MAVRIPLVIVNGVIQQLPSGDTVSGLGADAITLTNNNAGSAVIGMPVYSDSADGFDLALADAAATYLVIGLVQDTSISAAAAGEVQVNGILTATTGQWDAVTGDSGGLTAGSRYFLDPTTVGNLTTTPTTTTTEYVTPVGRALSTTKMELLIETSVLL
jgi:hypothetical protein